MPQRVRRLRDTLDELRRELDSAAVDADTRSHIRDAIEEIETSLGTAEEAGPVEELFSSLGQRFRGTLQQLEGSHPRLTAALGRVVDALSDLGI